MIYLDNAATTKPFSDAYENALKFSSDEYFNPSALYKCGLKVKDELSNARKSILRSFPEGYDLIFTSGGSEADNSAVFSSARRGNAVTTLGEHSAIYESFKEINRRGVETRFAPLKQNGQVDVCALLELIDENTSFVSVVHVNNETGALNDINEIAKAVKLKNKNVIFHSDGVQAFCKINYKISSAIDMYSVSAHKINAFKGTGALIKKSKLNFSPLIFGGGQEGGARSGTENVFGILAFKTATELHNTKLAETVEKFNLLKKTFIDNLNSNFFKIISDSNCAPHIISVSAVGLRGEVLQHMLEDYEVIVGTGSACSSKSPHSRILKNCGYSGKVLDGVLRISFSSETTLEEVKFAVEKLNFCAEKLNGIMNRR